MVQTKPCLVNTESLLERGVGFVKTILAVVEQSERLDGVGERAVRRTELLLRNVQGARQPSLRFGVSRSLSVERAKIVQGDHELRVLVTQRLFDDRHGSSKERFGVGRLPAAEEQV